MTFKQFLTKKRKENLQNRMKWDDYDLYVSDIPFIVKRLKDDLIDLLITEYGYFDVSDWNTHHLQKLLENEVMKTFPVIVQMLTVNNLFKLNEFTVASSQTTREIVQEYENTADSENKAKNEVKGENTTLSTTSTNQNTTASENSSQHTNSGMNSENTSKNIMKNEIGETGNRAVALSILNPEQDINDVTKKLGADTQGTPSLPTSNIGNATEQYSTINAQENNSTGDVSSTSNSQSTGSVSQNNTGVNTLVNSSDSDTVQAVNQNTISDNTNKTEQKGGSRATEITTKTTSTPMTFTDYLKFRNLNEANRIFDVWTSQFYFIIGVV